MGGSWLSGFRDLVWGGRGGGGRERGIQEIKQILCTHGILDMNGACLLVIMLSVPVLYDARRTTSVWLADLTFMGQVCTMKGSGAVGHLAWKSYFGHVADR